MKVIVVGGGLAGMTVAHELRRVGVDVTVLEASGRLGGKAGADRVAGRYEEHGYHIFPAWYANTRALLGELGIQLADVNGYNFLQPGAWPTFSRMTFDDPLSGQGLLALPDRLLVFYYMAQMLAHPLRRASYLDRLSTVGFLRSRWYATEPMARFNQENLLKAVAVPSYELSAFTSRTVGLNWVSNPKPFLSLLRGDLQTTWIEPYGARLAAMGVDVKLGARVTEIAMSGGKIDRVTTADGSIYTGDQFVLAANLEVARTLITDEMYLADPHLGRIHQLRSAPMSGLNLYLKKKLPEMPADHVFYTGGRYALSSIDVSQWWPGLANTTLCFIASDFRPIAGLTRAAQFDQLFGEIQKFLPITLADVDGWFLQDNLTSPLFMNTVASWPNRPRAVSKIPNLKIAGDFVKNHIDLATMEGAISSAQTAAAAILDEAGIFHRAMPKKPFQLPRALFVLAELLGAPAVPPLYMWSKLRSLVVRP